MAGQQRSPRRVAAVALGEQRREPIAMEALVGYRLRRVHGLFVEAYRDYFADLGLAITPVQGGILMSIERDPGLTLTELARRLQIETPTLHESLRRLSDLGYVARKPHTRDKRAQALVLTPAGTAAVALIDDSIGAQEAAALASLDEAERRQLAALLGRVLDGLAASAAARGRR